MTSPTSHPRFLAALLTSTALLALTAPAWADVSADADDEVRTVVVTGERTPYNPKFSSAAMKTDTALIDVPQSVSVIGEKQISDQSIQSMADAVRYVPGFGTNQGEGNRDGLVFRGNSSTADLFVDGLRDDVQYYRDTYNIERIEAFKGPNAMIFGRGSPGGLLNRVTKVADGAEHRHLGVQAGAYDKKRATVDYGTVINDEVSFRVTAVAENSESYRDRFHMKRRGVNPTLTFTPGDDTKITASYEYYKDERVADRGVPSYPVAVDGTRRPYATDASTFFGDPDQSPTWSEVNAAQVFVEHRFASGLILRNRFRVADYDKFYQNVFPSAINTALTTVGLSGYNNFTHRKNVFNSTDLIYHFETGGLKHTLLGGIEFGRQKTFNRRQTATFGLTDSPCLAGSTATSCQVSLSQPTVSVPVVWAQSPSDALNDGTNSFAAVYVQDQIEFNAHWQAVVGVRYDRFKTDLTNLRVTGAGRDLSSADDLLSPRLGLIYKPVPTASVYVSYGKTYLPRSGEQLASLNLSTQSLDPEEFENYELGVKWDITPDITLNSSVYRLNRSNAAVTDPADSTKMILLSGDSQRIEGFEAQLTGQITARWQMIAAYAYQDARTLQAVGTTPEGKRLAQTPKNSLSLWNRYDFTPKWGAALGVIYRDPQFAAITNDVTLKSYVRFDGAVYYAVTPRVQLQLNVENLTDTAYYVNAQSDNNITPGAPRSAYLTLNLRF